MCVNSRYYRERERDKRELLKMLVAEKKDKESVIYKLRTESGSGGGSCGVSSLFFSSGCFFRKISYVMGPTYSLVCVAS